MSRIPRLALSLLTATLALLTADFAVAQNAGRVRVTGQKQQTQQPKISEELRTVLFDWYKNTRTIETLEGSHKLYEYDLTFNVEKRGEGKFYYEAPDKGRIDIEPYRIVSGMKAGRVGKNGKPFALQGKRAVKWLCTGKKIYQIDPTNKKAMVYPIPAQAQGTNIMDGPLPFLLGMPPAKAVQRYRLKILKNTKQEVWLQVFPRWSSDAKNYREAKVILQKTNFYLPSAVQLIDPGGNQETVYTFGRLSVNKKRLFFWQTDPFKIDLTGYKIENMIPQTAGGAAKRKPLPKKSHLRPTGYRSVPDLSGMDWQQAKAELKKLDLEAEFLAGTITEKDNLVLGVEAQYPKAKEVLLAGQSVKLMLYVDKKRYQPNQFVRVPKLAGMPFKQAEKALAALGLEVEFRKGRVVQNKRIQYHVEEQFPPAGKPALKDPKSKVVLTLYVTADDVPKRQAAKP